MRRLTEAQYRNIINDIFGEHIVVAGRFDREERRDGLLAISTSVASVTETGIEQFFNMASNVAAQVVNAEDLQAESAEGSKIKSANGAKITAAEGSIITSAEGSIIDCPLTNGGGMNTGCVENVVARVGRLLFRRALTADEINRWTAMAGRAAETNNDPRIGLQVALTGLLVAPEFLFRIDSLTEDGENLSAYTKASRLSFFLWNTTPDDALLSAAEQGLLESEKGLNEQVQRMLNSEKINRGVQAFFRDFLALETFESLQKDTLIYPAFDQQVAIAAEEQLVKFLQYHLLEMDQDYRDIFTSRQTFMNRALGMIYQIPVTSRDGWELYTFANQDPRRGLLAHIGFSALHSHPGRSSATLRGIAIRERLLCQHVAPAPAAVNFTVVQDTNHPEFKTARERLTAHRTDPACVGCHQTIDPIGLALENFDGDGRYRETENDQPIDTSGIIDGDEFSNFNELTQSLHDHPEVPSCLVNSIYKYAAGREILPNERPWLKQELEIFASQGYRLIPLLKRIASNENFYRVKIDDSNALASQH